jgi:hypothetical protein
MNIPETYDYLVRARRDLWPALESVPDEVLSRPLLASCESKNLFRLCHGSSLLAQQYYGIDRQRALRRNPRSQ